MREKWAVVLGATGGSGAAIATELCRARGLNLFGVHRGTWPDEAARIRQEVENADCRCHFREESAASAEDAVAGVNELLETAGPRSVKVFVHALANASYGTFVAGPEKGLLVPKQFNKTFDVMAHSFVYWIQEMVKRDLLADNATLIALTNPMADSVVHGWGLIAATKAALTIYVRQMADELGPKGHRVCAIKYGLVETQAIRIAFTDDQWEALKTRIARLVPHRQLESTADVGRLVAWLATDAAHWFNGSTIDFTGGQANALLNRFFNPHQYSKEQG